VEALSSLGGQKMVTLTADADLLAILRKANGPAEIRDADGNMVGFFTPAGAENAVGRTEEEWEELRRRAQSTGGRTLKEIFQRMQSLTTDESERADLQEKIDRMEEEDGCDTR
jgi:hypothetical protein